MKNHVIFDTEIIGDAAPVFLICAKVVETGETFSFWGQYEADVERLGQLIFDPQYTWVGFNSENFDRPLIAALAAGWTDLEIKGLAQSIISDELRSWQTYRQFNIPFLEYDHIDLMEVPPGVMLSLKTYAGRMGYPTMVDMPFHHDQDLTTLDQLTELQRYCMNDIGVTEALFKLVGKDLETRVTLGAKYGVDLRSKSDAQCAEAILKKVCGINNRDKIVPSHVQYQSPAFIKTDSEQINQLIGQIQSHFFEINKGNGSPTFPEFLTEPIKLGHGTYQFGIGGLHSQHDTKFFVQADENLLVSDFDVASYYPNIMMKAGLIPDIGGGKGGEFLKAYSDIYSQRLAAKRSGDKRTSNTLKIVLNGTFGKLGSLYCSFYAPELMLAVTITGQLNLLCLIWELEKIPGVKVASANTDGLLVLYPPAADGDVLQVFGENAERTGFEYEETPYQRVAMRDVNSYIAVTDERSSVILAPGWELQEIPGSKPSLKRKGAFAKAGVMENVSPTMQVCADAAAAYLLDFTPIEETIRGCENFLDFTEIRQVKGGGVQHLSEEQFDDWELIEDHGSAKNLWRSASTGKEMKRKSKPKALWRGVGGVPFGRVARWYMTTEVIPAITYVGSGNKVAGTEGGKLCLNLPKDFPDDLNYDWYIRNTEKMLASAGVPGYDVPIEPRSMASADN
jgi:hypothetical protein